MTSQVAELAVLQDHLRFVLFRVLPSSQPKKRRFSITIFPKDRLCYLSKVKIDQNPIQHIQWPQETLKIQVIQVIQNDPSDVGVQGFGTFPALEAAFMEHVPLVCQNAGLILLGNFHPTGSQPEPALNLRVQQHGECRVLQEKNKPEQTLKKKKTTKIIKSKLDTGDPVFALCVFFLMILSCFFCE